MHTVYHNIIFGSIAIFILVISLIYIHYNTKNNMKIICIFSIFYLFICIISYFLYLYITKNRYIHRFRSMDKSIKLKYTNQNININSKLNNIPIYFINLNQSTDRLKYMNEQINFYNIQNVHRIEGIYGKGFSNKQKGTYTFKNNKKLNFEINYYDNYNLSELGCTLSHLYAIKTAYDNGNEYAIICEDDIYLGICQMWKFKLNDIINNAPDGWGLLQLYTFRNNITDYKVYKEWNYNYSTLVYLVNRDCMRYICNTLFVNDNTIVINRVKSIPNIGRYSSITADHFIYQYVQLVLGVYITIPLFISNNLLTSTIDHDDTEHLIYSVNIYDRVYSELEEKYMNHLDAKKSKILMNDLKIIENFKINN